MIFSVENYNQVQLLVLRAPVVTDVLYVLLKKRQANTPSTASIGLCLLYMMK